jgi:NAD(P)-dependent dehydrogenase (short-subunit alcohol dehydrogenase family)
MDPPPILTDRHVAVVGAAGKVGSTTARRLVAAGARVTLVDADARVHEVREGLDGDGDVGTRAFSAVADAADESAFASAIDAATASLGPLRGMVNLVGGVHAPEFGPFIGTGTRTYESIVHRNLRCMVVPLEVVGAHLAHSDRGGSIVLISAATAFASAPYHGLYGAAKAGVVALARTLAVEWGPLGIRVNTVAPGGIETAPPQDPAGMKAIERAVIPLGARVVPAEVADTAIYLLSDLASAVTGQTIALDGAALAKPAFLDGDNVPVFITDPTLRERIRASATHVRRPPEGSG